MSMTKDNNREDWLHTRSFYDLPNPNLDESGQSNSVHEKQKIDIVKNTNPQSTKDKTLLNDNGKKKG